MILLHTEDHQDPPPVSASAFGSECVCHHVVDCWKLLHLDLSVCVIMLWIVESFCHKQEHQMDLHFPEALRKERPQATLPATLVIDFVSIFSHVDHNSKFVLQISSPKTMASLLRQPCVTVFMMLAWERPATVFHHLEIIHLWISWILHEIEI